MINVGKLHEELVVAGIPIIGCDSNGEIRFAAEATAQQRTQAAAIVAAHDPAKPTAAEVQDAADRSRLKELRALGFANWTAADVREAIGRMLRLRRDI